MVCRIFMLILASQGPSWVHAAQEVEEDTPVEMAEIERAPLTGQERPWRQPDYSNQEKALGYSQDVFRAPKGMEDRVAFWKDIYTKYSTDQGVLHDSRYVHLVYGPVDFTDIEKNSDLTVLEKRRERRRRVDQAKGEIRDRLERLSRSKDGTDLQGEDLRVWKLFLEVDEKNKFKEAAQVGRLRFQLGQRDYIVEGIYQSGRYLEQMEEIFRQEGLPIELTRLPFVESSFNLKARSRVGASGIWQFMRSTARQYMRMDGSVDERNDPLRATRAAAKKLRGNFQMLGNWPLAVTGYNHGPYGVARLTKKYKTDQLAELTDVRRGRFGFASANFYASFIAALQVEQNAKEHFGDVKWMPELKGQEIKLTRSLPVENLLAWFKGDQSLAEIYNPHIRPHIWRQKSQVYTKNFIRVPIDQVAQAEKDLKELKSLPAKAFKGSAGYYVVQPGETLSEIGGRFGVKVQDLMELNDLRSPRSLRSGQKLQLPDAN